MMKLQIEGNSLSYEHIKPVPSRGPGGLFKTYCHHQSLPGDLVDRPAEYRSMIHNKLDFSLSFFFVCKPFSRKPEPDHCEDPKPWRGQNVFERLVVR